MAPNRKKGTSKASSAAVAAACRRWKVGDLVLAKVKGFPAWPATVSEPGKWGYSTDLKKVLVYFFGTKQIAFCNPADVESFTEEKKQTLLIKRQGKGADFVRAVQEISDSFENSKKQNSVEGVSSVDDVSVTKDGNLVDFEANHVLKAQTETPTATLNLGVKTSGSAKDSTGPSLPVEDAASAKELDALDGRETLSSEPTDNVLATETPQETTYSSRKRSSGTQPQNCAALQMVPSARRSRSSSRVENCRLRSFTMPSSDGNKNSADVAVNSLQDGSLRRKRCSAKYPDASVCHDGDAAAFVAGSSVDNGSEVATADSGMCSLNEDSTIESGCKYECSDLMAECLDEDAGLSRELDLQIKPLVTRKKRQPTRKRVKNDTATCSCRPSGGVILEVRTPKHGKNSPIVCEKSIERVSREDGDMHLPLVKRARVRMGESSSFEEMFDYSVLARDNSTVEVPKSSVGQASTSLSCSDTIPADRDAFLVKGAVDCTSPSINCNLDTGHVPALRDLKRNQPYGFLVDGEAALPPSKRLHRALEAMSANAAEDGQVHSEAPTRTEVNSSMLGCPDMAIESKAKNCLGIQDVESLVNDASQVSTSGSSPCLNPSVSEVTTKCPMRVDICNQSALSSEDSNHQSCKDIHVEAMNSIDDTDRSGLSFGVFTVTKVESPQHISQVLKGRMGSCKPNEDSLDLPLNNQGKECSFELSSTQAGKPGNHYKEFNCLELTGMSPRLSGTEVTNKDSSDNGTKLLLYSAVDIGHDIKSLNPQLDENGRVNDMCNDVNEVEHTSSVKDVNASLSPKLLKVRISAISAQQPLSCSPTVCVGHFGDKDVSCIPSSQSPTNRVGSPVEAVTCRLSSESSKIFQNNGCCSPDIQKKKSVCSPNYEGKLESGVTQIPNTVENQGSDPDAPVMLKSFEAMLGTLTRTKDNIGRATRIAIDCAKCGVAAEVVEILAHNLETESKLHRRVDLFFLVDSIVQCSRGLKDNVGGIYPSIVQAVLPRLLSAAAPPGSTAQENCRQCLKVLRLWLDRRILPESIIRCHMRKLDSSNGSSSIGSASRRSLRTERALDDPLREMEGMLVDEYGSNSSFQLPGFCMPRMLKEKDEESDSDGGDFEAVTPEHDSETAEERRTNPVSVTEKHRHILEDVDGELEMEDVAPSSEDMNSTCNVSGVYTGRCEQQFSLPIVPPLPSDMPPSSPPLPTSPPPLAPPLPSALPPPTGPPPSAVSHSFSNGVDSKRHMDAHSSQGSFQQSVAQRSAALRIDPTISDAVHYNAPEHGDFQMPVQISEPSESCSFGSFPVPHSPKCPLNNVRAMDGPALHRKAYHLRPPHTAPSNHFSYVQEQMPPRRYAEPPFCSTRRHFAQNTGRGTFYCDEDRLKSAAYERSERCRFSASSFRGRLDLDNDRVPYAHDPFIGPPHESPRIPNQGWAFPSRGISHRNFMPVGPPENAFPTGTRAPRFWRPR